MKTKLLLIPCFLFFAFTAFAQRQAERWYFGINAGLNFSSGAPVAVNDGMLSTTEGCSSIADSVGQLLFYTDGITVYNRQHTAMPNSGDLMGDISSTQSAIIVQKPGSNTLYYIFTVPPDGNPGFRYSVVDMTLDNGLGDVTAEKNVLILNDVAEKVSAVFNHDGSGYWIMAHNFPGNGFYAYMLSSTGLSNTPVISQVGSTYEDTIIQNSYGYMKFSPGGDRLGVAIGYQGKFEIYDFNDSTGVVSNPITLPTGDRCYGIEFSGNNSKLYTTHYNIDDLYFLDQYDLSSGIEATIQLSRVTLANPDGARALQLGPDGKMYLAKAFQSSLGVINYPDSSGTACDFQDFAISLDLGTCAIGLPGFVQSYFKDKGGPVSAFRASNTATCAGSCISFNSLSLNSPTAWEWHFEGADPDTSFDEDPENICYDTPGDYDVTLLISSDVGSDTLLLVDYIHVGAALTPPVITAVGNTLYSTPAANYQWYRDSVLIPGATSQVHTATQSGAYYVVVTDAFGCMASSNVIGDVIGGIGNADGIYVLKIFPNPGTDNIILELPYNWNSDSEIFIRNITGELIDAGEIRRINECIHLNIAALAPGFYHIHCRSGIELFDATFIRQ